MEALENHESKKIYAKFIEILNSKHRKNEIEDQKEDIPCATTTRFRRLSHLRK